MQIKSRNFCQRTVMVTLALALRAGPRGFFATQEIAQTQILALLSAKTGHALIITLLFFMQSVPAHAWRVYNDTDYRIRAKIVSGLGNTSCGQWDSGSGFEIGPGGNAGPNWAGSDCNPSGLQDQQFKMKIFICDPKFCPDDITFDPTDYVPPEGQMQTVLSMKAGGALVVHEQNRFYMGLPSNLYALTYYLYAFEGSSDYYARHEPAFVPPMQPDNRDVRFLVTGDPQYSFNQLDSGDGGYEHGTADAHTVLDFMGGLIGGSQQYRGMAITGDLTQNALTNVSAFCTSDELEPLVAATGGRQRFVYEGLGNHDIEDVQADCSSPDTIYNYVGTKTRNTNKTDKLGPHYSWDWHDVHFIQANLFPGDAPSPQYPGLDPSGALSFVKTDLARNVGNSGRPVVLFHHYGFDPFSTATSGEVWWTNAERKAYWDALLDYNVVAIFTGHNHGSIYSGWEYDFAKPAGAEARANGQPIKTFNAAAARGSTADIVGDGVFLDVHMTDGNQMVIERKDEDGNVINTQTVSFDAPTFNPISFDVGVIPDVAGDCPAGAILEVYQDNEDDNANDRGGWNGAVVSNTNTSWRFCRVDGRQFGKLPLPVPPFNPIDNDYAVLKLGDNCPVGSTEVIRFFDDEDSDNQSSMSGFSGPNLSNGEGTRLHFCHFRPQNTDGWTMPAFPDLGFEYGVFGQSSLSTDSGFVYTDDEDDNNANTLVSQFDFDHVIVTLADTYAYLIKAAIFSAPPNDAFDDSALLFFEPAVEGTLLGASNDGYSSAGTGVRQPDVWYKYRVTRDGMFRVDTCGSSALSGVNTILSIHDGDTVAGTTANELVANDNWSAGGDEFAACADAADSAVALMVSDGDELLIRVSKYDSSTNGVFALNWSIGAAALVTNGNDSGVGSLRYWLDLSPADSTITMSEIHGFFDIVLETPLSISKNVIIDGGGRSIIGKRPFSVMTIAVDAEVTLRSFNITGGSTTGDGGGIENNGGALTLISTNVTANHADGGGGGIANKGGSLTLIKSTISNNGADGNGGGIENDGGVVTLIDSTIDQNSTTRYGGGIINFNGSLTLTNSAVSANDAIFSGGGIYNGNTLTASTTSVNSTFNSNVANSNGGAISNYIGVVNLFHTTLVNNFALSGSGGGIYDNAGSVHIENTVVADNSAAAGIGPDFRSFGSVIVDGANLIGINEGVEGWFDELDPLVGTLTNRLPSGVSPFHEDNGGPTRTLIPFPGSPVIDAAITTANSPVTDQRGVARPLGCASDLGAVELEVADCDSDGDGLTDAMEITLGTSPSNVDSDNDGLVDGSGGVVAVSAYPTGIDGNGDGFVDGEADLGSSPTVSNIGDVAPWGYPDNIVNLSDLYILTRMVNGVIQPNVVETALGDIDGDGDLDLADLLLLQQKVLGFIDF